MKRAHTVTKAAAIAVLVGMSNPAAATELIVNGGFDVLDPGTTFPSSNFSANAPATGWIDQATWGTVSGAGTDHNIAGAPAAPASSSGGNWARQWSGVGGNTGTMLMQGFSATGLAAGTELLISFEYITQDALDNAQMFVYGLDAGEFWDRFPANPCAGCDLLASSSLSSNTQQWTSFSTSLTLTRTFTAIAFGVYFATINPVNNPNAVYWAGIDNVSIRAVPEPGSLALLGLGLLGLGLARRRGA